MTRCMGWLQTSLKQLFLYLSCKDYSPISHKRYLVSIVFSFANRNKFSVLLLTHVIFFLITYDCWFGVFVYSTHAAKLVFYLIKLNKLSTILKRKCWSSLITIQGTVKISNIRMTIYITNIAGIWIYVLGVIASQDT